MKTLCILFVFCVFFQNYVFSQEFRKHGNGLKQLKGGPGPRGPKGGHAAHSIDKCCKIADSSERAEQAETFMGYMHECHKEIGTIHDFLSQSILNMYSIIIIISVGESNGGKPKRACISQCVGKKMKIVS